jgi:phosphoribosylanthranilate isomerase
VGGVGNRVHGRIAGRAHNGVDEGVAAEIIGALPPLITPLLITYRVTAREVVPMCREMGVLTVQLHAPADPGELRAMREALPG